MGENASHSQTPTFYPSKDDVEWVAVDRHGRVGIFTTAGEGPVPRSYLQRSSVLKRVGEAIWALPECSSAVIATTVPRPDDFLAFARRGCFAFDWVIAHQQSRHPSQYALQARPTTPRLFAASEWPEALRSVLVSTQSSSLDFDQDTVDVSVLDCEQGS
jgi:hypothetical protein